MASARDVYKEILASIAVGVEAPSVLSSDLTEKNIVAFMNRAGRDVARKAEWPDLMTRVEIARQDAGDFPGVSRYVLPADFNAMATGGGVSDPESSKVYRPVVNLSIWTYAAESDTGTFFISDGFIYTGGNASNIALIYNSSDWVRLDWCWQTDSIRYHWWQHRHFPCT